MPISKLIHVVLEAVRGSWIPLFWKDFAKRECPCAQFTLLF